MREVAWWLFAVAIACGLLAWQGGSYRRKEATSRQGEPDLRDGVWSVWENKVHTDLALAGWERWGITPWHLAGLCGLSAVAGYLLGTLALRNQVLALFLLAVGGLAPWQLLVWRAWQYRRRITAATGESLLLIAQFCATTRTPYLGIWEALPALESPISDELSVALAEHRNRNVHLGEALRGAAARLGHDYYWHQFGVLTGLAIDNGSPLPLALHRLVRNFELVQSMQSRQRRRQSGYVTFSWFAYLASLAPPLYAWLFRPDWWELYVAESVPRLLLGWVVLSGFAVTQVPAWFGLDLN